MTTSSPFDFSNDRPVAQRQHDRLNRAAFADRISAVLAGLRTGDGLVIGIHGPWGDGKTTVLNLLRAKLDSDVTVVVRDFNPWRLADEADILRGFFSMLAAAINTSLSTTSERVGIGVRKWVKYPRFITRLTRLVSKSAETVDDLLAKFGELAASGDSVGLEDLRNRIVSSLKQSEKRIVVMIDDIDRLDKKETYMLFRMVKACADFPNVSYVLAFDDAVVARAIGERYGGTDERSGRAFLEKVVQVPLKLPIAATEDLRALCLEQVDRSLSMAGIELTKDQVREFVAGFDRGVKIRLTTPRAAKRFGNGLMFTLPMLKDETNPVDLVLVEALRAFFPEVHEIVRTNHSDFSGVESDGYAGDDQKPRYVQLLDPLLKKMPQEHAVALKSLLVDLFPRISGAYDNIHYGTDSLANWSKEQRISAPEYCPRYFSYTVPGVDVPDAEIVAILDTAGLGDVEAVETRLKSHLDGAKASRLIEKLRTVEATVQPVAARTLAFAMAPLGGAIPNPLSAFGFLEPSGQAAILISHLLRRIADRADRIAAGTRVVQTADPLWFAVECVRWVYVTDKPEKQSSNTFTAQETAEMRQRLVARIKSRAVTGAPLFEPDLQQEDSLLFEWRRAEGRDPVQAHLVAVFKKDPKQVGRFLQSRVPLTWSYDGTPHAGDLGTNQLTEIEFLIDLDIMAELIRKHCPGDLDNPEWYSDDNRPMERRLAEQFMFVFNNWKKDGELTGAQSKNEEVASDTEPV